ncbi:hypothetical protein ALI22I_38535 [Saccharothrix sp. ALI-22-I]|uniref:hypothetical protein n=1 Tax=Saccharothrix sp. ALI-22-I TaxID=1933778 RepID=UPI00097BBB64|nr:hypothetical protein [Saccharothrix sp. ALI-22-I]ONI82062.1 hypothetical protein ALI22I_38535 [Saccharothrix sp. ALI-22-I]
MKRVVIAALFLLTACDPTPRPTAPTTITVSETVEVDDTPVLDSRGVGAVRLGMTLEQLRATGEIGEEAGGPEFSCPVYALKVVRGWIGVEGGVAVEIRVEASVRTPENLRIGDSRARMHEVYPDVEQYPHGFIRALDGETQYKFFFENAGDTLTGMGLTRVDRACLT